MAIIDLNHDTICIKPTDDLTLYDKNHIMSRIEKFLFAICSLDSSDLPIPLSRIEELYNCLVTGDTPPTFEPLSRAEKFLMACLGAYDINKLPEPLSRSEVLLKKIATGDSNLEDVDNLKSKYEFLLAYIIQNGGINVDISHMKYVLTEKETTLYNTKERSVGSAILKGNTLVNLGGTYNRTDTPTWFTVFVTQQEVEQGNVYYAIINNTGDGLMRLRYKTSDAVIKAVNPMSCEKFIFTATESDYLRIKNSDTISNCDGTFLLLKYQEGMENWDITYFEGMRSVKMPVLKTTGKNLFDGELQSGRYTMGEGTPFNDSSAVRTVNKITVKPSTKYTISVLGNGQLRNISEYNNGNYIGGLERYFPTYTFETSSTTNEIHISFQSNDLKLQAQLEENPEVTSYEPYKSNILTCNEEVKLRGIGDIEDKLNLVTGEKAERVGEVILNGSENWIRNAIDDTTINCYCNGFGSKPSSLVMCDKLKSERYDGIRTSTVGGFSITLDRNITGIDDLNTFKNWLQNNNLTVVYPLETEVIKTVDLSIVDQDGNDTKLSSFNDITYVTLSSEGLIPEAELEVATKNEEVINTLSLEMDDISTAQTTLEETSNTQSENVDATMIATTEIYEGLL